MAAQRHPRLAQIDMSKAINDAARCRGSRSHRMDPVPTPGDAPRPLYGTLITWRCELCGTLRFDVVNRFTGQLYGRTYDHPDWYTQANDDKHEAAWWRSAYWNTLQPEYLLDAEPVVDEVAKKRGRKTS